MYASRIFSLGILSGTVARISPPGTVLRLMEMTIQVVIKSGLRATLADVEIAASAVAIVFTALFISRICFIY